MNTYQKIIDLERALMEDFKNSSNNNTYKEGLKTAIEALKSLHAYY